MLNLRYHIVSLVAVFLALALGILIGTTVLEEGVVSLLEAERDQLAGHRDRLAEESEALSNELDLWERFGHTIVPDVTRGRLQDRSVMLLVQAGTEGDLIDQVLTALEHAGATMAGRITFTEKWALRDEPAREQLALVLGTSTAEADALRGEAAARLAGRLAAGGDPAQQTDLLQSLVRNGFVDLDDVEEEDFPPSETLGVLISAAEPAAMPPRDTFVLPFLQALQDRFRMVVVEPLNAVDPITVTIRRDDVLGNSISTVDHADTLLGELSMIVALADAAQGGRARHWGVREGAAAIIPSVDR